MKYYINLRLISQLQRPELLNFSVTWSWSLTLLCPTAINLSHIQHLLRDSKLLSSSTDMTRFLLKIFLFLLVFVFAFVFSLFFFSLQYSFFLRSASINLLNGFFLCKEPRTTILLNLSSIHITYQVKLQGLCFRYFLASEELISLSLLWTSFKTDSKSALI